MTDIAISVQNVSKMYMLYTRPQDRLKQALFWRFGKNFGQPFWALHNVSFEVRRGESVGIVGRNGSGKSTLLQIVAGTLQPTTGAVSTRGRVAALLELGSGFNPEYTGRENVLMNGVILGLSAAEIEACFDDIVAFADIGDFINQPVKLYSSGMMVRLAFAVQAVVSKDILIVDEALAVGDEAFQKKCYSKLEEFQEGGGTVFLVSHNTQSIVRHCQRGLFLHDGELVLDDASKLVADSYQKFIYGTSLQRQETLVALRARRVLPQNMTSQPMVPEPEVSVTLPHAMPHPNAIFDSSIAKTIETVYGTGQAHILECGMYDKFERRVNVLVAGEVYKWHYQVRFLEAAHDVKFGMMIKTLDGLEVCGINSTQERQTHPQFEAGDVVNVDFELQMNLTAGTYYLNSGVMGTTSTTSGYLQRRVDISSVRVIMPDERAIYGVVYVRPQLMVQRSAPLNMIDS